MPAHRRDTPPSQGHVGPFLNHGSQEPTFEEKSPAPPNNGLAPKESKVPIHGACMFSILYQEL